MSRIADAFRSFFSILFAGTLAEDVAQHYGYVKPTITKPEGKPKPEPPKLGPKEGALQLLGLLQRDARFVDFLMEDISGYADDQVGAAVRQLHEQSRATLDRYVKLAPVIDGVENTFTKLDSVDPKAVKLVGNVPASGKAPGGTLVHRGWRAQSVDLPNIAGSAEIVAPAEVQID